MFEHSASLVPGLALNKSSEDGNISGGDNSADDAKCTSHNRCFEPHQTNMQRLCGDLGDDFGMDMEEEDLLDEGTDQVGLGDGRNNAGTTPSSLPPPPIQVQLPAHERASADGAEVTSAKAFERPGALEDLQVTLSGAGLDREETSGPENALNQAVSHPWLAAALSAAAAEWPPAAEKAAEEHDRHEVAESDNEGDPEYLSADPAWSTWNQEDPELEPEPETPEPETETLVQSGHQDLRPRQSIQDRCPRRLQASREMHTKESCVAHESSYRESLSSSMPISQTLPKLEWQVLYFTCGLLLLWMCILSWFVELNPDYRAIDFSSLWYLRIYDIFNVGVFFSIRCLVHWHGVDTTKKVLALMTISRLLGWALLCAQEATVEFCFEENDCVQKVVAFCIVILGHFPILYVLLKNEMHARTAAGFAGLCFLMGGMGLTDLRLAPVTIAGVVFLAFWSLFQIKYLIMRCDARAS